MKKHGKAWWVGWAIGGPLLAVPILYIGIFLVWGFIIAPYKADHARQQILTADPQALLAACREMIANRAHYRDDWPDRSWADQGERAMQRNKGEYGQDVPAIIRTMEPWHIVVNTNRVLVFVYGPPRTGFIGYTEGAEEQGLLYRNRAKMLTNGLWMFTH